MAYRVYLRTYAHRVYWVLFCDVLPRSHADYMIDTPVFCGISPLSLAHNGVILRDMGKTVRYESKRRQIKPCAYFLGCTGYNIPLHHQFDAIPVSMLTCNYKITYMSNITMTSWWARWGLKLPASRLFTQPYIIFKRKHQSSASLAFVGGIRRGQMNSPHKGPVTRKMFPFDDVIMDIKLLALTETDKIW